MHMDTVSEWLRRWTRNPLGSARVGSNPTGVVSGLQAITFVVLHSLREQRTPDYAVCRAYSVINTKYMCTCVHACMHMSAIV